MRYPKILLNCLFAILLTFLSSHPIKAVYDPVSVPNNKFGIHILFPEEITNAAKLVNSHGDWGYVTIPIQSTDRDLDKWQKFLDDCRKLHIIPIIRLATYPQGAIWTKPGYYDSLDWANFLNSLDWPTRNRYVIAYNEVNRAQEWGGEVNPQEYASILADTYDVFKRVNPDFYILNAGFDAAAPNDHELMEEFQYLNLMYSANPEIFQKIDGWASHSYPNPGFSASPYNYSKMSIRSYQIELSYLQNYFGLYGLKAFITETGWKEGALSESTISEYYKIAYQEIWQDPYLVTITPFLLSASGQFQDFSWLRPGNQQTQVFKDVYNITKVVGKPQITTESANKIIKSENKDKGFSIDKIIDIKNIKNEPIGKFLKWLFIH